MEMLQIHSVEAVIYDRDYYYCISFAYHKKCVISHKTIVCLDLILNYFINVCLNIQQGFCYLL